MFGFFHLSFHLCRKCKEDFAHSLDGIKTVTRDFLNRINNLFPHQLTFHLTCESQKDQMEKIRNSCTNLSRDVENKFQMYLDRVGDKVSQHFLCWVLRYFSLALSAFFILFIFGTRLKLQCVWPSVVEGIGSVSWKPSWGEQWFSQRYQMRVCLFNIKTIQSTQ